MRSAPTSPTGAALGQYWSYSDRTLALHKGGASDQTAAWQVERFLFPLAARTVLIEMPCPACKGS